MVIGDFDSYSEKLPPDIETMTFPVEKDDTEAMKATMKELEEKLMAIGQEVYKAQQAAQQQGGAAPGGEAPKGGDDDVIDAEVVNDDK